MPKMIDHESMERPIPLDIAATPPNILVDHKADVTFVIIAGEAESTSSELSCPRTRAMQTDIHSGQDGPHSTLT
jgi:hypothetical protein